MLFVRRGQLPIIERVSIAVTGGLMVLAFLLWGAARAQDNGPDVSGMVTQPAAPVPVQTVTVQAQPDRWSAVLDAIADVALKVVIGIGVLIGFTLWLARGWLMRKFSARDQDKAAVQTQNADALNAQSAGIATLLRARAGEVTHDEITKTAKTLEASKVIVIKPGDLPPEKPGGML